VYALRTGAGLTVGSARLSAIGPDAVYPQPRDSIGLLRVTFPGRRVLLAGAASQREMLEAVFRPVQLRADVLVLDAGTTPPRAFLRHVSLVRVLRPAATSRRGESPFTILSVR
jgi:hypothetical protein